MGSTLYERLGGVHAFEVVVDGHIVLVALSLIRPVAGDAHRLPFRVEIVVRLLPCPKIRDIMPHENCCHLLTSVVTELFELRSSRASDGMFAGR